MFSWLLHHPHFVLLWTLLSLLPLFSFFFIYPINLETDVRRGFAHKNGRSALEFKQFAEHFGLSYEGLELWVVLVTAKGGGRIELDNDILQEVVRLDGHLRNFSMVNSRGETVYSAPFFGGEINHLFKWYAKVFPLAPLTPSINLTYPMASVFEHKLFLGSHFFGVNGNQSQEDVPIETARTICLWYISDAPGFEKRKLLEDIEMDIFALSLNDSFSDIISFEMFGDQVANAEMYRGAVETRYLFIIGASLMVLYMAWTFRHLTFKSITMIIIGAMASPALATLSTFAILGWIGARMNSIMFITPFLVMAIGVDDGFLLLHSWRRQLRHYPPVSQDEKTSTSTRNTKRKTAQIIKTVLINIAPSMAITSLTNTAAFGVGVFSPTAQMSAFCLCTAMAISLDFFFEFFVFVPVMAIFYEERKVNRNTNNEGVNWRRYASLLLSPTGKTLVAASLATIYAVSFIGLCTLETSFDPSKAFPSDSQLVKSLNSFEMIMEEYAPMNLITRRPPNIENETDVKRYKEMVDRVESKPLCRKEFTQSPLMDYIQWDRMTSNDSSPPSYSRLPEYLNERMLTKLKVIDYHIEGDRVLLDGASFFIVCRGEMNWGKRARAIDETRKLLDSYGDFGTTLFDYDSTIYDIVISVKEEVIKAVSITFVCMAVACSFFIPSFVGSSVAAFSMLSITFTMLGFLSHWGGTLDPVTMINILMAVGFSVDFSAHICYHFNKTRRVPLRDKKERMGEILEAVGKPIFEASLSTFICVLPLFALKIYIFNSFAKTVCLVAVLGLFHGVVVIPVVLSFFLPNPTERDNEEVKEELTEEGNSLQIGKENNMRPLLTAIPEELKQ